MYLKIIMSERYEYRKLVLDPRCFKPYSEIKDPEIYNDAKEAIYQALEHPYTTRSERLILTEMQIQVGKNKKDK